MLPKGGGGTMADKTHDRFQLERMAFFSDAIFAIAITLLVIDLRLPEIGADSSAALSHALQELIPKFLGFVVSFFVIGRFWIGHHRIVGHLRTCDDGLVWRNLLFLLSIAFMPFPTAVISEYGGTALGVGFYALWLMFSGVLYRIMLTYALRRPELINAHDAREEREAVVHASWAPIIIGGLTFAMCLVYPRLALIPLIASPVIVRLAGWVGRRVARAKA
jgi:uncharacterized membrane protein